MKDAIFRAQLYVESRRWYGKSYVVFGRKQRLVMPDVSRTRVTLSSEPTALNPEAGAIDFLPEFIDRRELRRAIDLIRAEG